MRWHVSRLRGPLVDRLLSSPTQLFTELRVLTLVIVLLFVILFSYDDAVMFKYFESFT